MSGASDRPGASSACNAAHEAVALSDARARDGLGRTAGYLAWVIMMAVFFAHAEVEIEGASGWAANLPTWRIDKHWLLDVFWAGRAMTGYHAWMFSFMALAFFAPLAFQGRWQGRDAALAFCGLIVFWIVEDFTWFMVNPAWGWARFDGALVTWHAHWAWGAPVDYWAGLAVAAAILARLHRRPRVLLI